MSSPESVGMSSERLAKVDAVINESIANKETPGAVFLVARKGKIVYKKAYGNRMVEPRVEKMTLDTIFDMASVTKPVATTVSSSQHAVPPSGFSISLLMKANLVPVNQKTLRRGLLLAILSFNNGIHFPTVHWTYPAAFSGIS